MCPHVGTSTWSCLGQILPEVGTVIFQKLPCVPAISIVPHPGSCFYVHINDLQGIFCFAFRQGKLINMKFCIIISVISKLDHLDIFSTIWGLFTHFTYIIINFLSLHYLLSLLWVLIPFHILIQQLTKRSAAKQQNRFLLFLLFLFFASSTSIIFF